MASAIPRQTELITAYRKLYRAALSAVRYSKPSRYIVRDELRYAFRKNPVTEFDQVKINNTLKFLEASAEFAGMESAILKRLTTVIYWRRFDSQRRENTDLARRTEGAKRLRNTAFEHYEMTIAMLNAQMQMCLPSR
jgi:hypothetical protein